jgi:hypothetical protein
MPTLGLSLVRLDARLNDWSSTVCVHVVRSRQWSATHRAIHSRRGWIPGIASPLILYVDTMTYSNNELLTLLETSSLATVFTLTFTSVIMGQFLDRTVHRSLVHEWRNLRFVSLSNRASDRQNPNINNLDTLQTLYTFELIR